MAIQNNGVKVTAKVKAKLVLKEYLESFDLENSKEFDQLKRTEPSKVQAQIDKLMERIAKILVVKE